MPWKTLTAKEFAKRAGVDFDEMMQKHRLIKQIIRIRDQQGITQAQLAKKLGVSQPRIAKIESRVGTHKITFDALFRILAVLGYSCKVSTKRVTRTSSHPRMAA